MGQCQATAPKDVQARTTTMPEFWQRETSRQQARRSNIVWDDQRLHEVEKDEL